MKKLTIIMIIMGFLGACTTNTDQLPITPNSTNQIPPTSPSTQTASPTASATFTPSPIPLGNKDGVIGFLGGDPFIGYSLFFSSPDGSSVQILDKHIGKVWEFGWSNDGHFLAFITSPSRRGERTLYILENGHTELLKVSKLSESVSSVSWHPTSNQLVYSYVRNDKAFLTAFNTTNNNSTKLPIELNVEHIGKLNWSPDGEKISFQGSNTEGSRIIVDFYIIEPDGSDLQEVEIPGFEFFWSPDGDCYAVSSTRKLMIHNPIDGSDIELVDLPGGGLWRLGPVAWSPDGANLAVVFENATESVEEALIKLVSVDGEIEEQIFTSNLNIKSMVWTPDGRKLLFSVCLEEECELKTVTSAGENPKTVVTSIEGNHIKGITWNTVSNFGAVEAFIPATSTPVAPWELLPSPVIYDEFKDEEINEDLWEVQPSNDFSVEIENGAIRFGSLGTAQGVGYDLFASTFQSTEDLSVLEARLMISSASRGRFAFGKIGIEVNVLPRFRWATQCRLGNSLGAGQQVFLCDIADVTGDYSIIFQSESVPVKYDRWYTARIEINQLNGAIQFYLDEQLLATHVPFEGIEAEKVTYNPLIGVWVSEGSAIIFADDVRIATNSD